MAVTPNLSLLWLHKLGKTEKNYENINTTMFHYQFFVAVISGLFAPIGEIVHERMHLLPVNTKQGRTQNKTHGTSHPLFSCCIHIPSSFQCCHSYNHYF